MKGQEMEKANYSILVDIDRCIGCYACEVACKQEHDLQGGYSWIKVVDVGPVEIGGKLKRDFVPTLCLHCGDPNCKNVCPSEAVTKNSHGIVLINEELCTGCKLCLTACPVLALKYNPEKEVAEKCTLCSHRVHEGLEPACVRGCPTEALYFGETNEIINKMRKKRIRRYIFSQRPSFL